MWAYILTLALPSSAALANYYDRPEWHFLLVVFGIPVVDALVGRERGPKPNAIAKAVVDYMPHAFIVLWWFFIWLTGEKLANATGNDFVFLLLNAGFVAAMASVHGHELLHRDCFHARCTAGIVFALIGYGHFLTSHLNHHSEVGDQRCGSAPLRGMSFWVHFPTSVTNAFTAAWAAEKQAHGWHPIKNVVIRQWLLTTVFAVTFIHLWGGKGVALFVFQCVFAVLLVEVAGYIQHYGFIRAPGDSIAKDLAWDADFWLSNRLLLNNPFHIAHHRDSKSRFSDLHVYGPTLPQGYFMMLWIALVPPLWFAMMNKKLDDLGQG